MVIVIYRIPVSLPLLFSSFKILSSPSFVNSHKKCVCVWEGEREREKDADNEQKKEDKQRGVWEQPISLFFVPLFLQVIPLTCPISPPAPHPFISIVCILVQFWIHSWLSHLFCWSAVVCFKNLQKYSNNDPACCLLQTLNPSCDSAPYSNTHKGQSRKMILFCGPRTS